MGHQQHKIHRIQHLRFVAAFSVLFGHLLMEAKYFGLLTDLYTPIYAFPWGSGVDIFFIISGFIISHVLTTVQPTTKEAKDFFVRRLIRVVPIYWFYTMLMVIAVILFSHILKSNILTPDHIITSLLFVPWPNPSNGGLKPILGQGWTLNYEVFFYLLAFISVYWKPEKRRYFLTILLFFIFSFSAFFSNTHFIFEFFGSSIILEFIFGIWIYSYYTRRQFLPKALRFFLIFTSFVLFILGEYYLPEDYFRVISRGLPAALFTIGFVFAGQNIMPKAKLFRVMELLGDSSYSLYLSHPFILVPMAAAWRRFGVQEPLIYLLPALLLCILFSLLSYIIIEKPIISACRKLMNGEPKKI